MLWRLNPVEVIGMSDGSSGETVHARAQLRHKHQLTLPLQVRNALHLVEGDEVEFTLHADGQVTLRGMTSIPTDQRWFWTEEWQAGEREASREIAAGDLKVYDDMAALLADID
jgi:antitoxin PrlF